ncbi:hypothetical protein [Spiroplasma monobiae]|uniref:Transmembrane protein n=1 Tax=Spiroplasma monobiae MQ-1 TaxID=1336748 RepID=A0A2K9LTJ8_SPISQ|nr:hypothetical protein [Spiroplasma monobiae]AUM62357.1 hypothetical protein SMONO_v1c01040 [Spiroplasma monobiae MQ-1]
MKNFNKIFNPSNNWKTTFYLIIVVTLLTFFLAVFMGYQFTNEDGSITFKLFSLSDRSKELGYIREIFNKKPLGENGNPIVVVYKTSHVYALIAKYNLIAYVLWFIIPLSFTLNHFRLIHLVGKTRRTANASIVLMSSIVLLILVVNYWIGYFGWIDVMNKNRWVQSEGQSFKTWGYNWRTVVQQSVLIIGVALMIAMSAYNVFVETKTKYVSISKKNQAAN